MLAIRGHTLHCIIELGIVHSGTIQPGKEVPNQPQKDLKDKLGKIHVTQRPHQHHVLMSQASYQSDWEVESYMHTLFWPGGPCFSSQAITSTALNVHVQYMYMVHVQCTTDYFKYIVVDKESSVDLN